ncbi:MAG: CPBP family intramembrane metalloprotease [Acidobacteriota bacterium]
MLSSTLRIGFSFLLIVGVPVLSWRSARPEQLEGIPKTAIYFSAVVSQETGREKLWAVLAMAPTAGLCEEFLYRGFLLAEATAWFHSVAWGVVVSSAAFGFAHSYQGLNGMVRAGLLGALLAWPVVHTGSLYPSMAAHFAIDAVALLWLGPKFVRQQG